MHFPFIGERTSGRRSRTCTGPGGKNARLVQVFCFGMEYAKRKSRDKSLDFSRDFGALVGTRIPGPLIKSANWASIIHFKIHGLSVDFVD